MEAEPVDRLHCGLASKMKLAEDGKPSYRSWKKKYRKMKHQFDQKMAMGEDCYKMEQKALATARRLAIEKDRLLDLLLDVNNSAQIPPKRRFDLSLEPEDDTEFSLDIDANHNTPCRNGPAKSYARLLRDIPHYTYTTAPPRYNPFRADCEAGRDSPADPLQGLPHPPSFLTADDIDNYIWEIDVRLLHAGRREGSPLPPTLAPLAQLTGPNGTPHPAAATTFTPSARDYALRNPTSVYNWLRKHAPNTFLQDDEKQPSADKDEDAPHSKARSKGVDRVSGKATAGSARSKPRGGRERSSLPVTETLDYMEDELEYEVGTPASGSKNSAGKRKRMAEEDSGYRPKGGSSRPPKKKRKSEGAGGEGPVTGSVVKKARKPAGDAKGED